MNTVNTIDKLILCFQIKDINTIIDREYFNLKFLRKQRYQFSENIVGYENGYKIEKEINHSLAIRLEYNRKDIGTIFISSVNTEFFFFKYHKSIFYQQNDYTLSDIQQIILGLFDFDYSFHHISRLEIAADTIENTGNDLFVIGDLCSANLYFLTAEKSKNIEKSIDEYGGRRSDDAKYSVIMGNLKIYHHNKFSNTTCIGNPKSKIFIRAYNKSKFLTSYQKTYFQNIFPDSTEIFRLEVSLNSVSIEENQIKFEYLDKKDYLKYIFLLTAKDRLTFNDLNSFKWENGNKVYEKIYLCNSLHFNEKYEDFQTLANRYNVTTKKIEKEKSELQLIRERRASIGNMIKKFFNNEEKESMVNQIYSQIQSNQLKFNGNKIKEQTNLKIVFELIEKQLSKKNIDSGISKVSDLKDRLSRMVNSGKNSDLIEKFYNLKAQIKVTKIINTITIKEIQKQDKSNGIVLKKFEEVVSTVFI